jgi:serine/threonine protein kinase
MLTSNKGTYYYMSHEIQNRKSYGPKTDIWSAGCVLFELIFLIKFKDFIESKSNKSFKENISTRLCYLLKRYIFFLFTRKRFNSLIILFF